MRSQRNESIRSIKNATPGDDQIDLSLKHINMMQVTNAYSRKTNKLLYEKNKNLEVN